MFKVGDWVHLVTTYSRTIAKVSGETTIQENGIGKFYETDLSMWEPWQAQEGEWVVLKPRHPRMHKETSFTVKQYFGKNCNGVDIEPFIGELPTFLKN